MSNRYNNGSHYENHQRAAELHEKAAHAHLAAAVHNGKQDPPDGIGAFKASDGAFPAGLPERSEA